MRIVGAIAVFAALAATSAVQPAAAQSQFCLPLQMELAALNSPGANLESNDPNLRKKLDRARADARKAGCHGRISSRKRGRRSCRSIQARVDRLERQLYGSRRGGLFGFGRTAEERRRDRILGALARAGCSQTYRTICVRVCDGYYFPLSFAASRSRFAADAAKCLNQYELGEANLYYYPNPGGDVSQAVSLSGERYSDKPYAFLFRKAFQRQCAVRLHRGLESLGERASALTTPSTLGEKFEAAAFARVVKPLVPIPIARDEWSSDPETLANRAGSFIPERTKPPAESVGVADSGDATRTVGDEYLFAEANPGPPATVDGYDPPELRDFRDRLKATSQAVAR